MKPIFYSGQSTCFMEMNAVYVNTNDSRFCEKYYKISQMMFLDAGKPGILLHEHVQKAD